MRVDNKANHNYMAKKTNGNSKKSYGASTDDIMDFLEHHMVTKEEFGVLEKRVGVLENDISGIKNDISELKDQVLGLSNLIRRHLEISDDRYFEVRKKHELYEYWIKKMAEKLKMKLEIPKDLARAFS